MPRRPVLTVKGCGQSEQINFVSESLAREFLDRRQAAPRGEPNVGVVSLLASAVQERLERVAGRSFRQHQGFDDLG